MSIRVDNTNDTLYQPPALPDSGNDAEDEFLKLLVAQMQNQDPLNPQDGAEFVAQLAQFTNIELGIETNERLAGLQAAEQTASRASMMGLVGQSVDVEFSAFRLDEDMSELNLNLDLGSSATSVEMVVKDSYGNEVARVDAGERGEGTSALTWDGTDSSGQPLPPGDYSVEVIANHDENGGVEARATVSGVATSVEFTPEGTTLVGLGPLQFDPSAITSITQPSETTQTSD